MDIQEQIKCDVLVIGRGFAGMTAAAKASTLGLKTVQVGSSASFFLHSGLIDLLGVYPIEKQQVLHHPETGIKQIKNDLPNHPYSHLSYSKIQDSLSFVASFLEHAGLTYQKEQNANQSVLTAAGTFKPSFLVPKTMTGSGKESLKDKKVLFVDFKGLKGFSARQLTEVLTPVCKHVSPITVAIPGHSGQLTPSQLAGLFEMKHFTTLLTDTIVNHSPGSNGVIGLPAVCGLKQSATMLQSLEEKSGCRCVEIPGLPPSIPGIRLRDAFDSQHTKNNVQVLNNTQVTFNSHHGQCFNMTAKHQNIHVCIQAKGVILASGRFQGGGLFAERGKIREPIFNLPVHQPGQRNQWHDLDFFNPSGHAINRAGVETNNRFQPVDENSSPVFDRLYAAGTILAHNDWMRLKSGSGVCCASAVWAVKDLYQQLTGADHG